ncbi:E3 ubiquitin-protein ligase UBR7 [Paragonimus westermani]|uniref:E3 ubiquitin-protein ligase UBR7 n=1 Tax=Paragonimus westermani TaxID=34504 RepID=A0A5J4NJW4_9TREM|nr:E3 ubiquitin-protein ligase UBR7 [Paragonimus westermani]
MAEEDNVVGIGDVIQSIEEEKAIIMGGIDSQACCTFTKGYMKRQAVYTCKTCLDISTVKAGFCYPCLVNCHEGHDTLELYTKRHFRCDCGNAKFGSFQCTLWEEKDDENVENRYNSNFSNQYCTCMRPYPDEDYEGNEEMFQCGICEDWFHLEVSSLFCNLKAFQHLNLPNGESAKPPEEYEELTCHLCLRKHAFLVIYALHNKEQPLSSVTSGHLSEESFTSDPEPKRLKLEDQYRIPYSETISISDCLLIRAAEKLHTKITDFYSVKLDSLGHSTSAKISSVFWSSGWRERLCRCTKCKLMYLQNNLQFLLDPKDTMSYYLKLGEQRATEIDKEESDALSVALSELPHSVAITVVEGVTNFKKALEEFLLQKRDNDHVITEAEVRSFFEKLREQQHHQ